ncbi:hypothetical protein CRG98_016111 [Punica granatum]|uniref:Uncharacterized protein n=1 Tax=Punica granatum TaxID=22663 RepID=A0A2I0K4H4_PUNGR|nr:hypothetical protein CRG98_016111 [Punica granatum]
MQPSLLCFLSLGLSSAQSFYLFPSSCLGLESTRKTDQTFPLLPLPLIFIFAPSPAHLPQLHAINSSNIAPELILTQPITHSLSLGLDSTRTTDQLDHLFLLSALATSTQTAARAAPACSLLSCCCSSFLGCWADVVVLPSFELLPVVIVIRAPSTSSFYEIQPQPSLLSEFYHYLLLLLCFISSFFESMNYLLFKLRCSSRSCYSHFSKQLSLSSSSSRYYNSSELPLISSQAAVQALSDVLKSLCLWVWVVDDLTLHVVPLNVSLGEGIRALIERSINGWLDGLKPATQSCR